MARWAASQAARSGARRARRDGLGPEEAYRRQIDSLSADELRVGRRLLREAGALPAWADRVLLERLRELEAPAPRRRGP